MQSINRKGAKPPKNESTTGWTANSDLFMGIAILFLIMFVFALLSSGASQIAVQKEKMEAQKYLLGQIPEAQKDQTAKEMEQANLDLKEMAEKREILKLSLAQIGQMAEAMENREKSISNLYNRQNENEAVIKRSQDLLTQKDQELAIKAQIVSSSQAQREKLINELATREQALQKLTQDLNEAKSKNSQQQVQKASLGIAMQAKADSVKALEAANLSFAKQIEAVNAEKKSLADAREALQSKNREITAASQGQAAELEKLRAENSALKKANQSLEGKNAGLAQANSDLKAEKDGLGAQLANEKTKSGGLEGTLKEMGQKVAGLEGENKDLQGKNKGLEGKYKDSMKGQADGQSQLKDMEGNLNKLAGQLKGKDGELDKMKRNQDELEKRLAAAALDKKDLDDKAKELSAAVKDLEKEQQNLDRRLAEGQKDKLACEDEKSQVKADKNKLAAVVKDQNDRLNGASSSLNAARQVVNDIDNERKKIAEGLSKNLKDSGIDVDINPETGNITLRMDESFYFQNASYELREEAKQKIAKILPIYASSLLGNPQIAKRIESIHVTGYASPKFKKEFVDPTRAEGEAYEYNLELSVSRAREIVTYMLGTQIPAYPFKEQMRKMVHVSGMGLMKSIPHDPASQCLKDSTAALKFEECGCGPFDCKKSRRVEIQFVLKNQKDTDRQLQKISEKLKFAGAENVSH